MNVDLAKWDYVCRNCGWRKSADSGTKDIVFSGGSCPKCGSKTFSLVQQRDTKDENSH